MSKTTNLFYKLNYILYIVTVTMISFTNACLQHRESLFQQRPDYSSGGYEHGYHEWNNAGVYDNIQSPMLYNRENSAYSRGRSSRGHTTSDLQSVNAGYIYDSERTVPPFDTWKKTVEMFPRRESQRIRHTQHNHVFVRPVEDWETQSEEKTHKAFHVRRPVIQEILPVEEEVRTIVANNDNYGHARYQLRPTQNQDYETYETYEQKAKTDAFTNKKENNNDNNSYKSRNNPSMYEQDYITTEEDDKIAVSTTNEDNYNNQRNDLTNNPSTYDQDDRNSREVRNTDVSAIRERDNKKYDDQLNSFIGALYPNI